MNTHYDLSMEEQKILLTLASMVQPSDEEFKSYDFKIAEFMGLLGVDTKTKYTEIPKITKELMKKVFEIQEGDTLIQTAWLSGARYEKGSGMVTLKFNPDLKPYMIQLSTMFTQYKLANILSMKSKYSPRIYELLKCNQFKKQGYIDIDINDLRQLLKVENIYPRYYDFRRFILEGTQKELKKLTDISFDFEEMRTGRKITSIRFYIKSNINDIDEVCSTIEDKALTKENKELCRTKNEIKSMFNECITDLDVKKLIDTAKGDINIIKEKYNIAKKNGNIKNIVGWMLTAIKDDYKNLKGKSSNEGHFNDYEQRTYDFYDLEKKLLGWDNKE